MASFCSNCGAPVAGRFCAKCGQPMAQTGGGAPPAAPVQAAPIKAGGGSALKIILIIVCGLFFLGAVGIGGMVYVAYRAKQKFTQLANEYGVDGGTSAKSGTSAPAFRLQATAPAGSDCPFLPWQEASRILGIAIERMEYKPDGSNPDEECNYWVSPAERQRLMKSEIASGIGTLGKGDEKTATDAAEKLVGGFLGAVIEAHGDNKKEDPAMLLQVWRSKGRATWDKMEELKGNAKSVGFDVGSLGVQPVEGIGDKASMLPAGHSIMVLKGDRFFILGFGQFVPGREITAALAKQVVGRL
jgi:hypothetical protein